jgi:peptide/nickel transport system substrate-binding protein
MRFSISRTAGAVAAVMAMTLGVAACGGSVSSSGGPNNEAPGTEATGDATDCGTLKMAFNFDMQVPDPDIFYQADGLNVTQGVYEGLLRYKPNAEPPEVEPALAESYEVSDDGLTYTFKLRQGVKFQDGTDFNAQAMIDSFARRTAVNAGPAYMVSYIAKSEAPDPYTLVLHLREPNNAFIELLASPYGPKAVSPAAVKANAAGKDEAQKWLATHSAGTGPYEISNFKPGAYELTRFDGYWGTGAFVPACYQKVDIKIIPDFSTQALQLETGGLDIMTHGIAQNDFARFESQGFETFRTYGTNFVEMHLNTHDGPFSDATVRAAVPAALDRESIVKEVWGDGARVAKHIFPAGGLPDDVGTYEVHLDPSKLQAAVDAGGWSDATIDLAYTTDDPVNAQLAGLIAAQLTEAGLKTTARGVTQPETFDYPSKPGNRPDALVLPASPDAVHPWAWSSLFFKPTGGLSYFSPDVCSDGDQLMNDALTKLDPAQATEVFAASAKAYQSCGAFVPIADVAETIVAAPGMSGFEHESDSLWALRLASLRK